MRKRGIIEGWGVNDATYPVSKYELIGNKRKAVWWCPVYKDWKAMLVRSHNVKFLNANPTYLGCSVCEEWKYFSNFRRWVLEKQPNKDWENCMLDKDILVPSNKYYSPETCVYVQEIINQFIKDNGNIRGQYMIGVSRKDDKSKFVSKCRNPFSRDDCYTSYHYSELEAHLAWKKNKRMIANILADMQDDERVANALRARYL